MSRFPWRDTSTDIAGGQPPQWETPQGAQKKADDALKESKDYTDEQNANFNAHIEDATIHVTPADKLNWNSKAPGVHTHANATPTTPGFMSAEDKTKLNGVEVEANKYVHPATHPPAIIAQDTGNRFVSDAEKAGWSGKAEPTEATTTVKGLMSPTDKQKLNGIQVAAEVNQNAFSGVNDVAATSKTDTLQLTGGTGITITTNPTNKQVTITATGDATPGAHASSHVTGGTDVIPDAVTNGASGLMSGADAQYLRVGVPGRFEEIVEYVDSQIEAIPPVNDASLADKGIVMLSDATDGDRDTVAATEKAVGLAFQYGIERKAEVVAALNSIGVSASTTESWDQLIAKMSGVIRATGTATAAQVLAGSTFSNVGANGLAGAMVNRTGNISGQSVSNSSTTLRIRPQPGFYPGDAGNSVQITDPNFSPANIALGVSLFGKIGTLVANLLAYGSVNTTESGGNISIQIPSLTFDPKVAVLIYDDYNLIISVNGSPYGLPTDFHTNLTLGVVKPGYASRNFNKMLSLQYVGNSQITQGTYKYLLIG